MSKAKVPIHLAVNGKPVTADVAPRMHLADFLREELLLTGTHLGCEHGVCGACTVEIDGAIARSCITLAVACDGASVRTIEGFDDDPLMARLRQAFSVEHALQCGYCTPGMLVAARDLVRRRAGIGRPEIREAMNGNLCRCTGYMGIVSAIERVMQEGPAEVVRDVQQASWLGPSPGPYAAGGAAIPPSAPPRAATAAAAPRSTPPRGARAPAMASGAIKVIVGEVREAGGRTSLTQSFVLPHPRAAVWRVMSDIGKVATCLPGVMLDGPISPDGRFKGRMGVKLGPIAADFAGEGLARIEESRQSAVIEGHGRDRGSPSRVEGRVEYALAEAGVNSTRVDATIAYALTGPLAQFGRAGLVRDLVARIGEAFAQNLSATIAGRAPAAAATRINALSLLWGVIRERIRRLFDRGA